jgi:type IV pilus assembly protein PilA
MRSDKGFSLIELLIVVAIILIIAAIAIPNLLRAKISANEASAMHTVREITTAEIAYHSSYSAVGFAPDLPSLGSPVGSGCTPSSTSACLLDGQVSSGTKSGYQLSAKGFASGSATENSEFVASASPLTFNSTGVRSFCAVTDGVMRINPTSVGAPAATIAGCLAYPIAE